MRPLKKAISVCILLGSLLIFSSCRLPGLSGGNDKNTLSIASLSTSESQVLAHIVKQMIEYHKEDVQVDLVNNLGTSTVVHQAMLRGDVSISAVRYTGTDLSGALQLPPEKNPKKALSIVQKEFKNRYNQKWYPSYGFANSYAFMVSQETAKKYKLKKISDLKKVAGNLTAGVDTSWLDRKGDGYKGFVDEYDFDFGKVYPMQIGLVYDAVNAGKMDVVLGYSTDGRIASYDLVVLEDDLQFFPPYDASIVVGFDLLEQVEGLDDILSALNGKIDTKTMQQLNFQVDDQLLEPETVAKKFLRENNYFGEKGSLTHE
ncbi:osmoprotectant ABC transporter substrate-binding protein [Vagococcus xieshaowenii]|uniref:Osmoprotectant ABC transporter substrate-binding protein n=1 Tax=Vagococcus xieshaowenii TaxID=2562451 RepID=A0AAJ5EDK9_9ENTE|nr:osmoprotectant ABC transporter substrate-binding protein [Vagococcus xieshaowenii]QCA28080.1 osmoprotectant ABC transporter substrate-binding protein [Vagococcus xieshaowenii]TFZ40123.1 osmoprotectant ABC transporter substrate-binding protein [Vagococcus xieshaowenii]